MKTLALFIILLPLGCFAQFTVSGRVLNQADKKPVSNASVFLSNSSVGNKTADDGAFKLNNAKPGKYDLIISFVGFETYRQTITINDKDITLADIEISPRPILLSEVKIKPQTDAERYQYYDWFKDEFLGTSALAGECKILNPEILDLDYDKATSTLTASSTGFLEIENSALGYKIKYLLTDFTLSNKGGITEKVHYEGSALFEKMKGSPSRERHWQKQRQQDYEGSPMQFLRLLNTDPPQFFEDGFWVLRFARYPNPQRPNDSLIQAKINFYKKVKSGGAARQDSLSWWTKIAKLPKTLDKLMPEQLQKDDFVKPTDQKGLFALGLTRDIYSLYINYDKYRAKKLHNGHYELHVPPFDNLSAPQNTDNTLVSFNTPYAIFDRNGGIVNVNSLTFQGVWARRRVAELLPIDYEPAGDNSKIEDNIIAKLDNFTTAHIPEKAYLQFDKSYYAAGDTMYFKAYVTKGEEHQLSDLSGVLHVDLINTNNKIDQSIKLRLDSGIAWGDFALPDSLPKGNYRVRAYTQWMRNEGENAFFDQSIPVGSILNNRTPESGNPPVTVINNKPDIQFLPESGVLVEDVPSKIAFKAIGTNGLGVDVKGVVVDEENKLVCTFASSHLGMGCFYLDPGIDKKYKANITYADGTHDIVDLPIAAANGIILSVNNDSLSTAYVKIQATKAYYQQNRDKDFTLVISSGDVNTKITCTLDSAMVKLDILKRHLHTGIATFTLFSPKGEPLCERLLFVQNYDQLSLHAGSDKPEYNKREKVNIKLNAINASGDPASGHFSVAVIHEDNTPFDKKAENTILTNLLLTSDLKGYVEQPNYYFTDTTVTARRNLDLLMLTQGYRRFEWEQILGNNNRPIAYQPEKGLEISGAVKNLFDKPVAGGTITLLPLKGGQMLSSVTDGKGVFHFSNLIFDDTTHFVLSAVNSKGKNSTKITWFNEKPKAVMPSYQLQNMQTVSDSSMTVYLENKKVQHDESVKYGDIKGKMLKEVKIKGEKEPGRRSQSRVADFAADQIIHGKDILYGGPLSVRLMGMVHGAHFVLSSGDSFAPVNNITGGTMGIIIDGEEGRLDDVSTDRVENIEVLQPPNSYVYGQAGLNGMLVITTKTNTQVAEDMASVGILPITPTGFYKAREFYSPKYDNTTMVTKQRDLRSTIFWKPELETDKDGNASFEYYNADGTGTYRVVIEGIDDKGNLGRQVYRYKVE